MIELKFSGPAHEVRRDIEHLFGSVFGAPARPILSRDLAAIGRALQDQTVESEAADSAAPEELTGGLAATATATADAAPARFTPEEIRQAVETVAAEPPKRRGRKTDAEKQAEKAQKDQQGAEARASAATAGAQSQDGLEIGQMLGEEANGLAIDGNLDAILDGNSASPSAAASAGAAEQSLDDMLSSVQTDTGPASAAAHVTQLVSTSAAGASAVDDILAMTLPSVAAPPAAPAAEPSIDDMMGSLAAPEPTETYESYSKEQCFEMIRTRATTGGQGAKWLMQLAAAVKKATLSHMTDVEMRAALRENDRNPIVPAAA